MKYLFIIPSLVILLAMNACSPGSLPGPVQPPTQTATLTPTNLPTATIPATTTNTLTPTLTATATPVPNGPCDNPLLPLKLGNRWEYRVTTPMGESPFSQISFGIQPGTGSVALVEYSDPTNGLLLTEPVKCQDGTIVDYPLFVLNMLFSDYLDKYITASHASGNYAPGYRSLLQANWVLDWHSGYLTESDASFKMPSGDAGLSIPVNTPIDLFFSLKGERETVTVPAGNFLHALKITQDVSLPLMYAPPGSTGTGKGDSLVIITIQWYEPYVGLVRAQVSSVSLHVTQSLPHGFFDLPIESTLELVGFTPGN